MRRLKEFLSRYRRQAGRVVVVVALLAVALELFPTIPRQTEVEYAFGPGRGEIIELRVAYEQGGEELHGVSFRFDAGAPKAVRHSIELPQGEFDLRCELRLRGGPSRTVRRKLVTPADGLVRIRLGADTLGLRSVPGAPVAHPGNVPGASVAHPGNVPGAPVAHPGNVPGAPVAHPGNVPGASALHAGKEPA